MKKPEDLQVAMVFLRTLKGWNQAELAQAAGIDRGQISLYEAGKRLPSDKSLQRILDAAGMQASDLQATLTFIRLMRSGETASLTGDQEQPAGSATVRAVTQALETARAQLLMSRAAGKGKKPLP